MQRPLLLVASALALGGGTVLFASARDRVANVESGGAPSSKATAALPVLADMPELVGGTRWINSEPITKAALRGHVVMIEIWTYGCYNCLNALPHIKETAARYKADGLVTIGVHTPEFDREKLPENVTRRVRELGVEFPVVMDNDFAIWRAFNNRYWPSVYIVDKQGRIRFHHDGEGRYSDIDATVKTLLAE
jgi:thiol-disulfide isomerase/thioredoxin